MFQRLRAQLPFYRTGSRGQATSETTLLAGSLTIAVVALYVIVNPGGTANPIKDKLCQEVYGSGRKALAAEQQQQTLENAANMLLGNICPTDDEPTHPKRTKKRGG